MQAHWAFLAESYRGGPVWFNDGNLPKYPSEHPEKYACRKASASRDNYTREVVDSHTGYLFQTKPAREGQPKLTAFWSAAKRSAGDMDDLMAEAATLSARDGRVAIVIDKPQGVALSAADEKLPYAYPVTVLDLLDWAYGVDGELLWILTCERVRDDQDPMSPDGGKVTEQYRLRTRDGWSLWRKGENGQPAAVDEGTWRADGSSFGRVPVVIVDHQDSDDEWAPPGLVDEIARIDRKIAQEESSVHEVVTWQGAPTLTFPGDSKTPITLGVAGVICYSKESPNPPSFLVPDPGFLSALQERIEQMKDRIRELANLPTAKTGANQSGESKRWDSLVLQARLCAKAANLQAAELAIAQIVDLFMGGDGQPEVSIQYPSRFDVTTLTDDVTAAISLNELPGAASPTYRVQLQQRLARKSLPDLDATTQAVIDEEIEASITAGDTVPGDEVKDEEDNDVKSSKGGAA